MTVRLLDVGMEAGIFAILLLSPIPFGSVFPWAQAGLEVLVALTAGMWILRQVVAGRLAVRLNPLLWPGLAMLAIIAVQFALPGGTVNRYATLESLRLLVAYLTLLVVLSAYLVTPERIVRFTSILVLWGVALASWGLVNRALGRELVLWFEKEWYQGRLVSTFVNANHQALYFAVLLFVALGMLLRPSRRSVGPAPGRQGTGMVLRGSGPAARVLFGGATAVLGVALILTSSRGGVAAAAVALLVMGGLALLGRVRGSLVVGLAVSVGAFVAYVTWLGTGALLDRLAVAAQEPFADLRWEIWRAALRVASQAPVFGVGLGAFEDAVVGYRTSLLTAFSIDYAHNDYLQLLAEGGAVGVLILGWAAVAWTTFVVTRWRERQDAFVRGLVMGGLGAVAAAAVHSTVDFGLHMPANAVLVVAVLALLPAVVTLRMHRAGPKVDLREWRRDLGPRTRAVMGVATVGFVALTSVGLASVALADWKYQGARRSVSEKRQAEGTVTTSDFAAAEGALRAAARLDPWNPRIKARWATVADELGRRVWVFGLAPDGTRLRPDTVRGRLIASQPFLAAAQRAYEGSLRAQPSIALNHEGFGWFLARLDVMRRAVGDARLRDAVIPELANTLGSDRSLLPRALQQFHEAVRRDPASSVRRLSLVTFALAHPGEIPEARTIVVQESREAIRLDARVLPEVARLLSSPTVETDLLWRAVPRDVATLVSLGEALETQGRLSAAATALEDAVAIASTSAEKASVHLARARFLLRRGSGALALGQARQALAYAPKDADVFSVLAESYEASGMLGDAEIALGSALAVSEEKGLPTSTEYRDRLAGLLGRRGDKIGALALRRQGIRAAPNDAWAHLRLAEALEAVQERAEATREYETARSLAETDPGVLRSLAQAFVRLGLVREAVAAAEQAVRLQPTDDDLRVELGDLYSKTGSPDQAKAQYQEVLARQPAHQAASRGLRAVTNLQTPG